MELALRQEKYTIQIPNEVEDKIRILCNEIHNVEWSGVLFYTVEGSFENNLKIVCKDILLMDIGNSTYTEWNMNSDVVAYITEYPELLQPNVYQGLVHSHNNMSTFFSSTDTKTLQEEGSDLNHFVSLIVNNEGTYTAAITRKVSLNQDIQESVEYNSWGNSNKSEGKTYTRKKTIIEYFYLNVEICKNQEEKKKLKDRIEEIKEIKANKKPVFTEFPTTNYSIPTKTQPSLFPNLPINQKEISVPLSKILSCSLFNTKIKPEFIDKLDAIYTKQFVDIENYAMFIDTFVDFVLYSYVETPTVKDVSILAESLCEEIRQLPRSNWTTVLLDCLNNYIL